MELKSLTFLAFCLIVALVYFLLQNTDKQKYVLLAANFVFILTYSGTKAALALFIICVANFLIARKMEKAGFFTQSRFFPCDMKICTLDLNTGKWTYVPVEFPPNEK